jgi:hypothetical protein
MQRIRRIASANVVFLLQFAKLFAGVKHPTAVQFGRSEKCDYFCKKEDKSEICVV